MTEGRWLKASAFVVNDRQAVHHILSGVAPSDTPASQTVAGSPFETLLQGYVPGVGYQKSRTGLWTCPAAAWPSRPTTRPYGKATVENHLKLGLYFYPRARSRNIRAGLSASSTSPSRSRPARPTIRKWPTSSSPRTLQNGLFTPHSHKRGVSANVSIRYPDGKEETLLAMPRYDFNWQWDYVLAKPLNVPAGSKIITHWVYDNSSRNPGNPDPTKTVYWGEQSFEEMLAVYIHYHWAGETAKNPRDDYDKLMQANLMLDVMDDNMDGKLARGTQGRPTKPRHDAQEVLHADRHQPRRLHRRPGAGGRHEDASEAWRCAARWRPGWRLALRRCPHRRWCQTPPRRPRRAAADASRAELARRRRVRTRRRVP